MTDHKWKVSYIGCLWRCGERIIILYLLCQTCLPIWSWQNEHMHQLMWLHMYIIDGLLCYCAPTTVLLQLDLQMSLCSPLQVWNAISMYTLRHKSIYFLHKTKMTDVVMWIFTARSFVVANLCKLISLGHSMVDAPNAWKSWLQFSNGCGRISQTTYLISFLYIYSAVAIYTTNLNNDIIIHTGYGGLGGYTETLPQPYWTAPNTINAWAWSYCHTCTPPTTYGNRTHQHMHAEHCVRD